MKILLIANYEPDAQYSMLGFSAMLEAGLQTAGHDVRVVRPRPLFANLALPRSLSKWAGYADKFLFFPVSLRRWARWADVVHICDHSNAIYAKRLRHVPHVVTCHDLLAIRSSLGEMSSHRTRWSGRRLQAMILEALREIRHIACVSRATEQDLVRILGIEESEVSVIYNGFNFPYTPLDREAAQSSVEKICGTPFRPFLLHVGGNHWYKNRLGLLKIFSHIRKQPDTQNLELVMTGEPLTAEMNQFIREQRLEGAVSVLFPIRPEDLRALYSSAEALIFPSLYEGFGWPIIEAQACGCLVATSGRAPMTEVGRDAAVYFDPEDPKAAAEVIASALPNGKAFRQKGLENAKNFSTASMIHSYIAKYERVLGAQTHA